MKAVFKREMKAYFTSPIAYVVIIVMILVSALVFGQVYAAGSTEIAAVFSMMFTFTLFVVPILTMRLLSEDKKQKTEQLLLTSPISHTGIVAGKFLAALSVFSIATSITVIYELIIVSNALKAETQLGLPIYFGNLFGLLFVASALIAIGLFISSLTESQVVAAIVSFSISLFLLLMSDFASFFNVKIINAIVEWFSFGERYSTFTDGRLSYSNVIFFLAISVIFLFLTTRVLEKKRWS